MTPRKPTWLSRLMVTCWAGQIPMLAWFAPSSLVAEALMGAGTIANFFVLVLAMASGTSLVDCFVNDALPKWATLAISDYRHIGFMVIAISLFMIAGIVGIHTGSAPLLIELSMPAFFSAIVVWPDLFYRHQRAPA